MSYTAPTTVTTGDLITAATWNQDVVSNVIALTPVGLILLLNEGGAPLTTGIKGEIVMPGKADINGWYWLGDQSGSIQVDIYECTYAQYDNSSHPVSGDTICSTNQAAVTTAHKGSDTTLTNWTKALAKLAILRFIVDNCTSFTRGSFTLTMDRT